MTTNPALVRPMLDLMVPWPSRRDLRARLIAQGVEALDADLLATLTQDGKRPDLQRIVRAELGAPKTEGDEP